MGKVHRADRWSDCRNVTCGKAAQPHRFEIRNDLQALLRTSEGKLDYGGNGDGFLVQRDPDTMLSPDASLYLYRQGTLDGPWMKFAPEIVVEVLSPSNIPSAIIFKTSKYFAAGTEQVWIADIEKCTLEIHFRDGRLLTATEDAEVTCEGIAKGLVVKLKELFAPV